MTRSAAKPQGVWRGLQLLLSPLTYAAKVATGIVLFLVLIAAGLIWAFNAWVSTLLPRPPASRQPAEPPAEVRALIARLASIPQFQGVTPKDDCKRRRRVVMASPPRDSCTFDFGKTSVRVSWATEPGHSWIVTLKASIPDAERTAYPSASLSWPDFSAIHQFFCRQDAEAAAVMESLQRLAQMPWVRWEGGQAVPAGPNELNARRSVTVNGGCGAHLTEIRGKDQLQVTLAYSVLGHGF
jgi:hypothetical protein